MRVKGLTVPRKRKGAPRVTHLTKSAYARRIGVSPQHVGRLAAQGKIRVESDGKIDPIKADAMLKALRRPERDPFRKSVIPDPPPEGAANAPVTEYDNYHKARTIQAEYRAQLTQLEFEQASGVLINKDEVKSAMFDAARTTRDAIMAIPKRISALIAAEKDRLKVETLLRNELQQALSALAENELAAQFGGGNEND